MIKERYCSYEVAKLLKEKGFDERSAASYDLKGQLQEGYAYWNNTSIWYAAPTHQMAIDWLREKHNILIWFYPIIPIPVPKDETVFYWEWKLKKKLHSYPQVSDHIKYKTLEEAIEAALKYSLTELIK